ncbi:S1C family serine protease [Streptomyces sp. NPDC102406]|uniref:S1C family serine protease n=1 Tax=Streptomyces sp. NPDC102406 TaxID=3366171 RepID=UPI003809D51E
MDEGKPTKAKWWSRPRPDAVGAADDGDWHLPAPAPASSVEGAAESADAESADPGNRPVPPAPLPSPTDAVPDAYRSAPAPAQAPAPTPAPSPEGDAPRPLHDPDPYSTPPYGEPGPWAPAPPVQHPVATPAHGTAILPGGAPQQPYPGTPGAAQQPPQTQPPQPAPLPVPAPVPGPAPAPVPELPYQPWQRYDPWAAPEPGAGGGSPRGRSRRVLALGAAVIALVAGVVGGALGSYLERNGGTDVALPQAGAESAHRAPGSIAGIAASALPGVVTIHTEGSSEQGTGTGFVLDDRGHILTNNHVVDPAGSDGRISVTFAGGDSADADVVGHDSGYDLAVIKVSGVRGLKPLPLGNSANVQVGDPVVAIGAPFDLANTVTSGIISAKDRPITAGGEKGDGTDVSYVDALQTDAPINPGNSGGPLVDSRARVIGINSAIRSADSGAELDGGQSGSIGLGFAIPINQAKRVAEELINTGKATHPVIGVTLDMDYSGDGARVGTKGNKGGSAVSPRGPGDKAGIEPGDVITEVDGVRVHSGEELIVKIRAHRPKDELSLTVERDGKERRITLVLGSADGR